MGYPHEESTISPCRGWPQDNLRTLARRTAGMTGVAYIEIWVDKKRGYPNTGTSHEHDTKIEFKIPNEYLVNRYHLILFEDIPI